MTIIAFIGIVVCFLLLRRHRWKKRNRYIEAYEFPESIQKKLTKKYPQLSDADVQSVMTALKVFFVICNARGKQMVSMPSQVVDVAWHEFILYTRQYKEFCDLGLGGFLHHTPADAMQATCQKREDLKGCCMSKGLEWCWQLSCAHEGMDHPAWLPLLFSIDEDLQITDGYTYDLQQCIDGRYDCSPDARKLSSSGTTSSAICVEISAGCGGCGGCGGG